MEFRILGPLEVHDGHQPVPVTGAKERALLGVLLLHANEAVSSARLVDALWGEQPPATAEKLVQGYVHGLRERLGAETLVRDSGGYRLQVEPDALDLFEFRRLVDEARDVDGDAASDLRRRALALWHGDALVDVHLEGPARQECERLGEMRLEAQIEYMDGELARGRHAAVIGELEALAEANPYDERVRAQLMLALYRSGRQTDALEAYHAARTSLRDDLGLEPGPSLRELETAILRHDASLLLAVPAPPRDPPHEPTEPDEPTRPRRRRALVITAIAGAVAAAAVLAGVLTRDERTVSPTANSLAIIDGDDGDTSAVIPVRSPGGTAVGEGAVWVVSADQQIVSRIDPRTNSIVDTIPVGEGATGVVVANGFVWVLNAGDATVSRVDPSTNRAVETIRVGSDPSGIAATSHAVWVANRGDATATRIDAQTGLPRTFSSHSRAIALAVVEDTIWLLSEDAEVVTPMDATGTMGRPINVGNGPRAIAAGAGAIWVANGLDGTVMRIDPRSGIVDRTITVPRNPRALVVAGNVVWVAHEGSGTLTRIDSASDRVLGPVRVGPQPAALAVDDDGSLMVALSGVVRGHRGGTLRLSDAGSIDSLDTALGYDQSSWAVLGLTNDGLVAFERTSGGDGSRLVANLAQAIPPATNADLTYTFRLRRGMRYSTRVPVRASDVRLALERVFALKSGALDTGYYRGIVGARQCGRHPKTCDLSRGIVTDNRTGTVTFHLTAPDPEFLDTLALPFAFPVPRGTPLSDTGTHPLPATGPYMIERYVKSRTLTLVRNPAFREWSSAAKPDGYVDRIEWRFDVPHVEATRAVKANAVDVTWSVPTGQVDDLRTSFSSRFHDETSLATQYLYMNTRLAPFENLNLRRAVNHAINRATIAAFWTPGRVTCQILPPEMPGYEPYCPYTANPETGGWKPDMVEARRLARASGTAGQKVTVWAHPRAKETGRYVVNVLRSLGLAAQLHVMPSFDAYNAFTASHPDAVQMGIAGWGTDYPKPRSFIAALAGCPSGGDAGLCDEGIERAAARAIALEPTEPQRANAIWAGIDRTITDQAGYVFFSNPAQTALTSARVRNYRSHVVWTTLLEQLWVR